MVALSTLIYGITFVGIDNLGVDLRGAYVGVTEKLGDGVEVDSVGEGEVFPFAFFGTRA